MIDRQKFALAAADPAFRHKLLESPEAAFRDAGLTLAADREVAVLQEDAETRYLVLPMAPEGALSEESLTAVQGGLCCEMVTLTWFR